MTLSDATTPSQSGPGRDDNKGVLRIPQSSIRLFSVISLTLVGGVLPIGRDELGVYYDRDTPAEIPRKLHGWYAWRWRVHVQHVGGRYDHEGCIVARKLI